MDSLDASFAEAAAAHVHHGSCFIVIQIGVIQIRKQIIWNANVVSASIGNSLVSRIICILYANKFWFINRANDFLVLGKVLWVTKIGHVWSSHSIRWLKGIVRLDSSLDLLLVLAEVVYEAYY